MGKERLQRIVVGICFSILFFFMMTIVLRIFTRVVIVQRLRVENNAFVNALFFDQKQLVNVDNGGIFQINEAGENILNNNINWAVEYPFYSAEEETISSSIPSIFGQKIKNTEDKVNTVVEKIESYATSNLFGQLYFVDVMNRVEKVFGWNLTGYSEYNGVIVQGDGRLTEYLAKLDAAENVQAVTELNGLCAGQGIDFLYVQSPHTNCKYNRKLGAGLDYSNQNADMLLAGLADAGVAYLDLRECLHADGLNHAEAFYRTDHHWKAETGLWAAGKVAEYLNQHNGFSMDLSLLDRSSFSFEVYPEWFLGTRGKKVTLSRTSPEDFTLIWPNYDTEIHYEIPGKEINVTGDFSVTYDRSRIDTKNYYVLSPYGAYNYGDNAVTIICNLRDGGQGKRLLIIKDSFVNTAAPFLGCVDGAAEVEVLDIRHFLRGV